MRNIRCQTPSYNLCSQQLGLRSGVVRASLHEWRLDTKSTILSYFSWMQWHT